MASELHTRGWAVRADWKHVFLLLNMDKKEFIKLMELLAGIPPEELYDRIFGVDPEEDDGK